MAEACGYESGGPRFDSRTMSLKRIATAVVGCDQVRLLLLTPRFDTPVPKWTSEPQVESSYGPPRIPLARIVLTAHNRVRRCDWQGKLQGYINTNDSEGRRIGRSPA